MGARGRKVDAQVDAGQGTHPAVVPFAAYHELVMEVARMKREGFTAEPAARETAPDAPNLPPVIEAAVIALGVDPQTERQLRKTAWERLRAEVSPEEIAQQIETGEEVPL